MEKEDAIELVQNLKNIRDEIVGLLNQANEIVSKYENGVKVVNYNLNYLESDIRNIERREGLRSMTPQYFGDRCPECGASSRILVPLRSSKGNRPRMPVVVEWMPAFLPNGQAADFAAG